jgi:type II secretory pathway pseudopilin PulG
MRNNNGFTLVEILVALFIGILMLMAIYSAVNSAQQSTSGIEKKVIAQQDARNALELMAMEIRMASYNPNLTPNIWLNAADCSAAANQNYKGIQEATANSMIIEMDVNDSSVIGDHENEIITYNYDTVNQYVWRETRRQGACVNNHQPFLGATNANQNNKTVLVVNNSLDPVVPVFRYYDGSGTEIAAPVTTKIPDIRRVEITLVLDTADSGSGMSGRKRIIYSTSVIPHNHITTLSY